MKMSSWRPPTQAVNCPLPPPPLSFGLITGLPQFLLCPAILLKKHINTLERQQYAVLYLSIAWMSRSCKSLLESRTLIPSSPPFYNESTTGSRSIIVEHSHPMLPCNFNKEHIFVRLKLPETSLGIVPSHQLELPWVVSSALAEQHNIMEMSCRRFFWNRVPPSSSFFKPTPAFFDTSSSQGQSTPRSSLGWNFTLIEGWKYIWFVARSHVISPFDWGDGCQDLWFAIHNLVRMANRGIQLHKCWNAVTPETWWQESDFLICGFGSLLAKVHQLLRLSLRQAQGLCQC